MMTKVHSYIRFVGIGAHHLRRVSCLEVLPFHCLYDQQEPLADEAKFFLRQVFGSKKKTVKLKTKFRDLVFNVMMMMFAGKRYCQKKIKAEGDAMELISLQQYVTESFRLTTGETDKGCFMPILKSLGLINALDERCKKLQEKGDSLLNSLIGELRPRMPTFSNET